MHQFKIKHFSLVVVCILVSLFAATANAQWQMSAKDQQFYTNNPCSSPFISWALFNESAGFNRPTGGIGISGDCDPSNYGSWSTAPQLETNLRVYRQLLARQGLKLTAFQGRDGNAYVSIAKADGIVLGIDASRLVSTNGGNVIAQGGGNFVPAAQVIAQGGGNVIAQGGGNFRGIMASSVKKAKTIRPLTPFRKHGIPFPIASPVKRRNDSGYRNNY